MSPQIKKIPANQDQNILVPHSAGERATHNSTDHSFERRAKTSSVRRSARLKMDTGVDEERNTDTWLNQGPPSGYDGDQEDIEREREAINMEEAPPQAPPGIRLSPISSYLHFFSNVLLSNGHLEERTSKGFEKQTKATPTDQSSP